MEWKIIVLHHVVDCMWLDIEIKVTSQFTPKQTAV